MRVLSSRCFAVEETLGAGSAAIGFDTSLEGDGDDLV